MQDPVGTFDAIRDNFIRYVRTAFFIQNPILDEERTKILRDPTSFALYRTPWIEPVPRYKSIEKNFQDITYDDVLRGCERFNSQLPHAFTETVWSRFKNLVACGLFPADRPLYAHQFEMMVRAICGESLVITAGTGSGKTESFLLPIFGRIVMEASAPAAGSTWNTPVDDNAVGFAFRDSWWMEESNSWRRQCKNGNAYVRSYRVSQRSGEPEGRAAVRALILYPMNALVEDQMSRLRKALDSGASDNGGARSWFDENLADGQRIYFGRYNGETPVPGHETEPDGEPNVEKIGDLKNRLFDAQQAFSQAQRYDNENNGGAEDVRYFFPSVDGAEMRSRWDMQESPPDILVTNFSMLSMMLMRDADKGVFDQTREWLRTDPERNSTQPQRVFHLVVDELHLYRGTAGTEVAYLIRLLLDRLDLESGSHQLRILASSASLAVGDNDSNKFVREFFGRESIGIIPGSTETIANDGLRLAPEAFIALANRWTEAKEQRTEDASLDAALNTEYEDVAAALGGQHLEGEGVIKLLNVLTDPNLGRVLGDKLLATLQEQQGSAARFRAYGMDDFGRRLFAFANDTSTDTVLAAVRGLLIARGRLEFWRAPDGTKREDPLPSFRLHWFLRNLEGLWASPDPSDDGIATSFANPISDRPIGRLYPHNREVITPAGNRILEVLYCEQCGDVFLGGVKLIGDRQNEADISLLSTDPDLEAVPDKSSARLTQEKSYAEYGVFWPSGQRTPSAVCPDADTGSSAALARQVWGPDADLRRSPSR